MTRLIEIISKFLGIDYNITSIVVILTILLLLFSFWILIEFGKHHSPGDWASDIERRVDYEEYK